MKKAILVFLILLHTIVFAQIPKPLPNTYVNDYAKLLDTNQKSALNKKIRKIETQSGIQLAIVLVDKIPAEYEIEDFSLLIGRKWGVGKNKDGIVYVAAISQRKQRLEVARNSESVFTEERSKEILNAIKPYFKTSDYYGGLNTMVDEVASSLNVNLLINSTAKNVTATNKESDAQWYELLIGFLMFAAPFALIYYFIRRKNRRDDEFDQSQIHNMYNDSGSDYPRSYSTRGTRSTRSSGLGSFVAGAALGYAAHEIADRMSDKNDEQDTDQPTEDTTQYGNWSSGDSSGNDSGSSSSSGFSGGGATSDW